MTTAAGFSLIAAAALLVVSVGPASARRTGIGFTFAPQHVLQGDPARIAVKVRPAGARCTLGVRYLDGGTQPGLAPTTAVRGHAQWTWNVPTTVEAGAAQATVRCSRAGAVTRRLVVVGRLIPPKIDVQQQGFSVRPRVIGSRLSYGLILHNESTQADATKVTVQTNFVLADGFLLGTDTQRVSGIAAGSNYALGNTVSFPGAAPIVRLETVITVGSFAKATLHFPTLANMHLVPSLADTKWLGSVEGELQNTDPADTLQMAQLSAVVFDAQGNVVGGGIGFAPQTLPPGAREALKLQSGFDAIPMENAASVQVSITPTWVPPGA